MIPRFLSEKTVRAWKQSMGLTYQQLAALSHWSPSKWRQFCTGNPRPCPHPKALYVIMAEIEEMLAVDHEDTTFPTVPYETMRSRGQKKQVS